MGLDISDPKHEHESNGDLSPIDVENKEQDTEKLAEGHEHGHENPITRTLKSIKRRATLTRSRQSSNNLQPPPLHSNLGALREQMIRNGEYGASGATLDRINTTHELPGLSQAETLLSYHTRNSIQLDRIQ